MTVECTLITGDLDELTLIKAISKNIKAVVDGQGLKYSNTKLKKDMHPTGQTSFEPNAPKYIAVLT